MHPLGRQEQDEVNT